MFKFNLRYLAILSSALLGLGAISAPAQAATVCIESTIDADGEFLCTLWENTDPSDGSTQAAPTGLQLVSRTSSSVVFAWDSYEGATGWVVSFSSDNAKSWRELIVQDPEAFNGLNLTKLSAASALWLKVAALTPDRSAFGDVEFASTKGAKPVAVRIVDANGKPVQGGQLTWALLDNSAKSSKTYGLTDKGLINFPSVPAGLVQVNLTDGLTADGAIVSGSWRTTLGFESPVLKLPEVEPNKHVVRVVLENGMPVIGARVSIPEPTPVYGDGCLEGDEIQSWVDPYFDEDGNYVEGHVNVEEDCTETGWTVIDYEGGAQIDSSVVVEGFSFTSQVGPYEGITDLDGRVTIYGFFAEPITASIIYDDGVITQQQDVPLTASSTRVELDYVPYVAADYPTVTVTENQLVPITVSVTDAELSPASIGFRAMGLSAASVRGVRVSLVGAKGLLSSKCKSQLTGISNSKGKVTFKICAAKSGTFTVKGAGVASVSTIRVQVKGTAPLPVRSLTAKSPFIGKALITWAAPIFDGKSTITSYKVTASAKGKKTITKVVKGNLRTLMLTGLANGTTYQINVVAINKKGSSDPVTVKVPVA